MNTYGYVGGDPLNRIDLFGLDFITFDGSTVTTYTDKGEQTNSWSATSGQLGTSPANSYEPFVGPIPEGRYTVNPANTNKDAWWKYGWGDNDAWGTQRTEIIPNSDTFTNNRGGFNFHGGKTPGSAGCVDLTDKNDVFHEGLQKQNGLVDVYIDYPNYRCSKTSCCVGRLV